MNRRLSSALPLALLLILPLAACGSKIPQLKKKSADHMITVWNVLKVVEDKEGDAFTMPGNIQELADTLAANPDFRASVRETGVNLVVTLSPLAKEVEGVERPHYRLLATSIEADGEEPVLIENPALYGDSGAQVCRADNTITWLEGPEARELWDEGR